MTRSLPAVSKGLLCIIIALSLDGCMVGPDYSAPQSDLGSFHNISAATAGKRPAPALEHWWTGFHDQELTVVIQRALDQNLDLAAAIARVSQARAGVSGAKADLLPTVDLNASSTYQHQSLYSEFGSVAKNGPGFYRDGREENIGPSATWELDLFGGLRRGVKEAKDIEQAAEADQAGTRVSVAADAADAYFQIRGYQARLAVAQNQISTDEHLLKLVNDRLTAGVATQREVAQADALLKLARAIVPPLRLGLEQQMNRLDVLMGAQPGTYARELANSGFIAEVPPMPGSLLPADLLRRRPDVIAAERRLGASNEQIGVSVAEYYPKISLSAALGLDSLKDGHLFTGDALQALGSGALRWRLFDFGKVDAEVAQAKGANAEVLANYRKTVLGAAEDVEDSLAGLAQTEDHVRELQDAVVSLKKSRDLTEAAYKAGSITLTDVLDADRELLTTQDELDANRANGARAAVGVFRAFGGGWDPQPTPDLKTAQVSLRPPAGL